MQDIEVSIKLSGSINTNPSGITKLLNYYNELYKYTNKSVVLDLTELTWIDANLSALLNALTYRLVKENNLKFFIDHKFLATKFSVLIRNGLMPSETETRDNRLTTLELKQFLPIEQREFAKYVNQQLMCHRGLTTKIEERFKNRIKRDLIEISTNILAHAQTNDPFFVCGQYYPTKEKFIFTMVDLGIGFLGPINKIDPEVLTDFHAIKWALNGNSTKIEADGGLGLSSILDYFQNHAGDFHICTGNSYWSKSSEKTFKVGNTRLLNPFRGTFVSLCFDY
jgi:hypothetical protein